MKRWLLFILLLGCLPLQSATARLPVTQATEHARPSKIQSTAKKVQQLQREKIEKLWLWVLICLVFPPMMLMMGMYFAGAAHQEDSRVRQTIWPTVFLVLFFPGLAAWGGAIYFLFSDVMLSLLLYSGLLSLGLICLVIGILIGNRQWKKIPTRTN